MSKCKTKNCRKKSKNGGKCWTCIKRNYAERYPVKYAYQVLKNNAKRRGHKFTITLQDFIRFCVKTKILLGRGRTKDCYSIDRIKEEKGYEKGNLQVLTVSDNRLKYSHKQVKYDYENKVGRVVKVERVEEGEF